MSAPPRRWCPACGRKLVDGACAADLCRWRPGDPPQVRHVWNQKALLGNAGLARHR